MKERSALAGSLLTAFLASACCIGPLLLGALGIGSLGLASALAPLRPWLLGVTALLLAFGFYQAYRPRAVNCSPGDACSPASRRGQRIVLWVVTVLAAGLATYPSWARPTKPVVSSALGAGQAVTLDVQGMTCSGCEAAVETELRRVPGVVSAAVSFERKRAEIRLDRGPTRTEDLIAAVKRAGYHASVTRP